MLLKRALPAAVTALTLSLLATAGFAQTPASDAMMAAPTTAASAPTAKQQRKASRQAAHAKNKAELQSLEKQGYDPAAKDPYYPNDVQNAERKAAAANGGSGAMADGSTAAATPAPKKHRIRHHLKLHKPTVTPASQPAPDSGQ